MGSEEGTKGGRKQSIPGKTCRKGDAISGRDGEAWGGGWTTKPWEETGAEAGCLGSASSLFHSYPWEWLPGDWKFPSTSGARAIAKSLTGQFRARRNPEASLSLPYSKVGGECVC